MSDEETYKTFSDDDISVICGFYRDQLKAENERLRKEIAALEETTEHCCKPAQEEVSRLWHENERLRKALEDCREASGYINGEVEIPRIVKAALKEKEHD